MIKASIAIGALVCSLQAVANSKWVRLSWDGNASNEATISFTPNSGSSNPYIRYGYDTNTANWQTQSPTFNTDFKGIFSQHTRLNNLIADSAVHFQICDDNGCGQRYWFKTASDSAQPFVMVAGGDTRTGHTNRRQGNQLIAKIRPLFIMHGGDYTNSNNNSQWQTWLDDWTLTYSDDVINNINYTRIYPLVSTHGNHEDNDSRTTCKIFGIDANRNNQCDIEDTYYAVQVSPLLRAYTLNSQFYRQSVSLQNQQNNWLTGDISTNGQQATWRFAQYHKPMFPHTSSKSDNLNLFNWWADTFYQHALNLAIESDTHLTKITEPVIPGNNDFNGVSQGVTAGTMYIGEGSWGAPARSANDGKDWTIDMSSIQQFKVITVSPEQLEVRTAKFDQSASTLSRQARQADATQLPEGIAYWQPNGFGDSVTLKQNSNQLTYIERDDNGDGNGDGGNNGGGNNDSQVILTASADAFISSSQANNNFGSSNEQLLSDGSDSSYGEMQTLIAWDTSAIPNCATITSATLQVNVTNVSSGQYGIYQGVNTWQESQVTWNSIGGDSQQGDFIGAWTPSSTGTATIALNALAVSALQGSLTTNSINVVIASQGTSNGLDMRDRESNQGPKLTVKYQETDCQTATPEADYTVVVNGASAQFSDLSSTNSGDIVDWLWDFGDNESSAQQNPSHEYIESGTYNVILTVANAQGGSDSISKTVVITNQNQSQVFETRIATGNDDAEESSSGSMNLSSSDMELIRERSDQTVGLRFTDVNIPAGATITQAYLQFTVDETGSNTTNLLIRAEDTDDAERFTSQRYNISNRATSNAAVNWQPPAWNTISEQGTKQKTPDLSALVQETINNNGWTANNSMVFIITGEGKRTAEAYNGRSAKAAALHITYTLN